MQGRLVVASTVARANRAPKDAHRVQRKPALPHRVSSPETGSQSNHSVRVGALSARSSSSGGGTGRASTTLDAQQSSELNRSALSRIPARSGAAGRGSAVAEFSERDGDFAVADGAGGKGDWEEPSTSYPLSLHGQLTARLEKCSYKDDAFTEFVVEVFTLRVGGKAVRRTATSKTELGEGTELLGESIALEEEEAANEERLRPPIADPSVPDPGPTAAAAASAPRVQRTAVTKRGPVSASSLAAPSSLADSMQADKERRLRGATLAAPSSESAMETEAEAKAPAAKRKTRAAAKFRASTVAVPTELQKSSKPVRVPKPRVRRPLRRAAADADAADASHPSTAAPRLGGARAAVTRGTGKAAMEARREERRARREREAHAVIGAATMVEPARVAQAMAQGQAELRARARKCLKGKAGTIEQDTVSYFLTLAGQEPLLTVEEEVELARQTRELLRLEEVRTELEEGRGRKPTDWELAVAAGVPGVDELVRRTRVGQLAKERMVRANMRLVVSCAKRYQNQGLHTLDLWQEGNLGLIKGVERFDPNKGFRLSTYAYWWIRQSITRAIAYKGRAIRLPMRTIDALHKINGEIKQYMNDHDYREPTNKELAEITGMSEARVATVLRAALPVLSLDAGSSGNDSAGTTLLPKGLQGNVMIQDEKAHSKWASAIQNIMDSCEDTAGRMVGGDHFYDTFMRVEESLLKEGVRQTLERTLCPREVQVLQLRYGLFGQSACTPADMGKELGISRERVRQIEKGALKKLMRHEKNELRQYLWMCIS